MDSFIIILAAVLPAFVLAGMICWADRRQPEPFKWINKAFWLGVLSILPALIWEMFVKGVGLVFEPAIGPLSSFWNAFMGAALPEEACKLFMLYILLCKNPHFDEHFDAIVYAAIVSLGFAAFENISYLFNNMDSWQSVAFSRAIFSVPGHFMFGITMGYFYAKCYYAPRRTTSLYLAVLAMPVMLHTIYDGILFYAQISPALGGILTLCFYAFCFWMYRGSRKLVARMLEKDKARATNIPPIRFF